MDWMKTEKVRKTEMKKCEEEERIKKTGKRYADYLWSCMNLRLWMEYGDCDFEHRNILWIEKIEADVSFLR